MTPEDVRRGAFAATLRQIEAAPEATSPASFDLAEAHQVLACMNPSQNMGAYLDLRCQIQEWS